MECSDINHYSFDISHSRTGGTMKRNNSSSKKKSLDAIEAAIWVRFPVIPGINDSHLHVVRGGRLRGTARPLVLGKRTQVWEAGIRDDRNRLVATGRVRLLILDANAAVAGKEVGMAMQGDSAG